MDVEQAVRDSIDKTFHMSLATVSGDSPWVCEVHFAYDEELNLYWRSLKSRRHSQEIAANPKVAGNIVDKYELGEAAIGLYFEGSAQLLGPGEEQAKAAECLKARLKIDADLIEESRLEDGHQLYKTTITKFYVFGKFENAGPKKYELLWNGGIR